MTGDKISVVIPSYRSRHLGRVIARLKPLRAREIIVVDSSPERPSVEDGVILIHQPRRLWPGEARNQGAARASADYLLFIDSDLLLTEAALRRIGELPDSDGPDLIAGIYDAGGPASSFLSRLQDRIAGYRVESLSGSSGGFLFLSSHFLIKRSEFERTGGFHEQLRTYEDVEFFSRARRLSCRARLDLELKGAHLKEFSLRGYIADYSRKTFNCLLARRRYPEVFSGQPFHAGRSLAGSWIAGAALWAWGPIFLSLGRPAAALLGGAAFWAVSSLLLRPALKGASAGFQLRAFLVWPVIGLTVACAAAGSAMTWRIGRLRGGALWLRDFAVAAWRVLRRSGLPVSIVAYVTARCNLRCEHCFYLKTLDAPDPGELPLEVFERATRGVGPVLWFSLGGGEPFLRKDLGRLLELIQRNCRPKILSLPTNGWYTEQAFQTCLRALQGMKQGSLILFFSLDGPKEIHDVIRGSGSFDRVRRTMDRLRPLRSLYPNFYMNVITTVTERNASVAAAFVGELARDFQPDAVAINLFRHHAPDPPPLPPELLQGYKDAVDEYHRLLRGGALGRYGFFGGRILLLKELLQKELIYRVAKHDEFVTPCTAGTLSYVIAEDGAVKPCEILPDTLGRVTEPGSDFQALVAGPQAGALRDRIRDSRCKCTWECAMSVNALFSWPMTRRLLKSLPRGLAAPAPR